MGAGAEMIRRDHPPLNSDKKRAQWILKWKPCPGEGPAVALPGGSSGLHISGRQPH